MYKLSFDLDVCFISWNTFSFFFFVIEHKFSCGNSVQYTIFSTKSAISPQKQKSHTQLSGTFKIRFEFVAKDLSISPIWLKKDLGLYACDYTFKYIVASTSLILFAKYYQFLRKKHGCLKIFVSEVGKRNRYLYLTIWMVLVWALRFEILDLLILCCKDLIWW